MLLQRRKSETLAKSCLLQGGCLCSALIYSMRWTRASSHGLYAGSRALERVTDCLQVYMRVYTPPSMEKGADAGAEVSRAKRRDLGNMRKKMNVLAEEVATRMSRADPCCGSSPSTQLRHTTRTTKRAEATAKMTKLQQLSWHPLRRAQRRQW